MDNTAGKNTQTEYLHDRLLTMAKVFHAFCAENGLQYYMLGGTMLGAVRHKGFIPWDDDMDFGMPRKDYDRFLRLAQEKLPEPFEVKYFGNVAETPIHYAKMIDGSTTLIEDSYHNYVEGLYIDIFPLDGTGTSFSDRIRMKRILYLQRLIINHCSTREKKSLLRKAFKWYADKHDLNRLHLKMEKLMTSKDLSSTDLVANYLGAWGKKEIMRKSIMGLATGYQFEDTVLFGSEKPDEYLTNLYGDYMQLPPEDKRVFRHNYYVLDYNTPYKEYIEKNK